MDITWLLLIFFVIAILQPIIRQRMLETTRTRMFRSLEAKRGSRVISLIHRQEQLSFLGFPIMRYIDINDSEEILRAIKLTDPHMPIDIILHTPGGLVLAAEQIAVALCRHQAKVTVFIPHYAMSGGTLIALAADEIIMDENAVLGPVDPQIGDHPAVSILAVIAQKDINRVSDETLIHADMARKAIQQVKNIVVKILGDRYSPEIAATMAETLSNGRWTHDYPIAADEARQMGLVIHTEVPTEVYQLMNLYPQTGKGRPSVEYIPVPYPLRRPELGPGKEK
jgi:ClpP class serine protease